MSQISFADITARAGITFVHQRRQGITASELFGGAPGSTSMATRPDLLLRTARIKPVGDRSTDSIEIITTERSDVFSGSGLDAVDIYGRCFGRRL